MMTKSPARTDKVMRTEEEWKALLTPTRFNILRREGTEPAFQNEYWDNHEDGTYVCAGCRSPLFSSEDKFDSGTGWPSFTRPIASDAVGTEPDTRFGMRRTSVLCARCDGHLGHLFDDGPPPLGTRYCMNSGALDFIAEK